MLLDLDCSAPPAAGCSGLFDEGNGILQSARAALVEIDTGDACSALEAYVTMGSPLAPLLEGNDRLSVNLVQYGPTAAEQQAALTGSTGAGHQMFEALWRVELWMQGYPTIGGEHEARLASAEKLHAISGQLYRIAALMYQRVLNDRVAGTILCTCTRSAIGVLTPLGPSGGLAGWGFSVKTVA